MSDNSTDFTEVLLVDVQLKADAVKAELPGIITAIDGFTAAQKKLTEQGQKGTAQWVDNAASLRALKVDLREANKYVDNVTKAMFAENNSIAQNRALLSALTADHIKLGQANGDTKAKIDASAKAINDLTTTLKAQESQIGQNYRNVGNYADSIGGLVNKMGGAVPVFQQFNTAVQAANEVIGFLPKAGAAAANGITAIAGAVAKTGTQFSSFVGFKQFNTEAAEAAETATETAAATEATGVAATEAAPAVSALAAVFTGIFAILAIGIGVLVALKQYLSDIGPVTDTLSDKWAGFKASFVSMANSIRNGDFANLASDMSKADKEAQNLNQSLLDLEDAMVTNSTIVAQENAFIATQMLKLRNIHTTADEAQKIFTQVQATAQSQYVRTYNLALDGFKVYAGQIKLSAQLTDNEYKTLLTHGVAYAEELKDRGKRISDSLLEDLAKQQIAMTNAQGLRDQITQRAQNREEQKEQKDKAKAEAAKAKADKLAQDQAAAFTEVENLRTQSESKELQAMYEQYGNEAIAADQNYNNELAKLKKFRDKKLITQQEYNAVEKQLSEEQGAKIAAIVDKYQKEDAAKFQAAQNALIDAHIQNIQEDTARQVAQLTQQGVEKQQAIDQQNDDLKEADKKLSLEISNFRKAGSLKEMQEAEAHQQEVRALLEINGQKQIEIEKQTATAIAKVRKSASDSLLKSTDSNDVQEAGVKGGPGSSEELAAKQKQLQDNYNIEVSQASLTADAKLQIERKYLMDRDALDKQFQNTRLGQVLQNEQVVQSAAFDILTANLQARSEKILKNLDDSKNAELENTNLTGGQKKAIEAKFTKLENAEKLKQFKLNQKLQVANILISAGAAAIKTYAEYGFTPAGIAADIALGIQTAATIAKVLTAKPGFAQGGQFISDGKGALLPGYSKHDNINSSLRSGEAVVVSEAMRDPWARSVVSNINQMYGGRAFAGASKGLQRGFAIGGIFSDGGNANRYYSQPVIDAQGLANTLAYQLVNNFPPIIADIKDINTQQGILIQTKNRVEL